METIIKKEETRENIPAEVSKPVIDGGVMEKLKEDMSPNEISDTTVEEKAKMKESVEEKAIKEKTLKDKILSFFKVKTITEMTDLKKIEESLSSDISDLTHIKFKNSGVGFTMDEGGSFKDAIVKYNLGDEGINLVKEWKELSNKIDKSTDNDERVSLQTEINNKKFEFMGKMRSNVDQRIQELEQK
jgi:hypothetical protein